MFSGMNQSEPEKTTDMFGSMTLGDSSTMMFETTEKSDPAPAASGDLFSGLNTQPAASTSDSIFNVTKPSKANAADNLLANAFSSSTTTSTDNNSNLFMTSSQPVQNQPAFNLTQPASSGGLMNMQPQTSPFMPTTTQPSSGFGTQPMPGFGVQPQQNSGGFGFVNQPSSNTGFPMQANAGFGMQTQPTGFGMRPAQPSGGFGMQPNTGFGMQAQPSGFGMQANVVSIWAVPQASAAPRAGVDHFANLLDKKEKVPN
eukprot:TRINITY_DN410_c0_g1_i4.p1 TRINITY_DN410_c0_g1~~TRINITY_DN410_c0_g1_i4.p1  ORF type:complete len:257 (+),score=45.32 TRINITY_DN410_c0_g1_i4:424-1194(+)